eukprot:2260807-Amphidinium_carterae.1
MASESESEEPDEPRDAAGSTCLLFQFGHSLLSLELFQNKVNFGLQMLEEIHTMPTVEKTVLNFSQAANIFDTWLQKIEVAKNYEVSLEPQKLVAIVNRLMEMTRGADGTVDQILSLDWHMRMRQLGVRDETTLANVEMLSKHLLACLHWLVILKFLCGRQRSWRYTQTSGLMSANDE